MMKKNHFILRPGNISLVQISELTASNDTVNHTLQLHERTRKNIIASQATIQAVLNNGDTVYGVNTGLGILARKKISAEKLEKLQHNLVKSHAAGTGELLSQDIVQLVLLLKINSLARAYSGVSLELIDALIALYNAQVYPCIPSKGSVGASGDLAPLAHLACVLIGEGSAHYRGDIIPASKALRKAGLKPLTLKPKEGLALVNGTQVSTAIALNAYQQCLIIFNTALIAGAMSVDAASASVVPFDKRIHNVRGHQAQTDCAATLRQLLENSAINKSHHDCERVQDPYSLRCQPQVMGACLQQMRFVESILATEINAVSDNPIVFGDDILSGGNFHAEPVAFAADNLALAIAEIGALSERRIAVLINQNHSGLPAFIVNDSGLNSGFMIPQVTAAALASENKSLAHPASVDSIPTSANQEDHVSMATFAANRLMPMLENTATIVAIELLAACQGIECHAPLQTSEPLQKIMEKIREKVAPYEEDRVFAPDIQRIKELVLQGEFSNGLT